MAIFRSTNHVQVDFDCNRRRAEGKIEEPGAPAHEEDLEEEEEKV